MGNEAKSRKGARKMLVRHGYKAGGKLHNAAVALEGAAERDVHKHETHLHKGKPKTHFKDGGCVEGMKRGGRADKKQRGGLSSASSLKPFTSISKKDDFEKYADGGAVGKRGKKGKGGHNIHIVVATPAQGGQDQDQAKAKMAFQAGVMAGAQAGKAGAGGPPPGGMLPGAGPGGPPPGMPPGGPMGGPPAPPGGPGMMKPPGMKDGGVAHPMEEVKFMRRARGGRAAPHMTAGAGSGEGRLEKTEDAKRG